MAQLPRMKDADVTDGVVRGGGNEVGVSGTALGNHRSAPKWIELLPAGDFAGRDGRGPFRLSNPEAVIAATQGLRLEAGLPIDYDHATDFAAPAGRPAPAAGWIRAIEVREGALWGQVEWTRHGAAAVVTHEYRYISPVFEYSQDGEVQRLLRAALTNNPNLYLTAISSRETGKGSDSSRAYMRGRATAAADRGYEGDTVMDDLAAQLRGLLGLDEEATTDEIMAAVRSLLHEEGGEDSGESSEAEGGVAHASAEGGVVADPARYVPVAQFENALTELNRLRASSARERAGYRVDAAMKAGKIVPAQREWAITYCQANTRGFEEFVARQPAVIAGIATSFEGEPSVGRVSINDREAATHENGRAGIALTRTELTVCARLGLRPQDYLRRRSMRGDFLTANQE
jgi:phage I-like protein